MNGIDCASSLNITSAQALKKAGIEAVGRYLGGRYALAPAEVKAIHDAGMALWLIYETTPTSRGYFNYNQGLADAKRAVALAEELGAPHGITVYFTVDYDAKVTDIIYIEAYLKGVREGLGGKYLLGIYGSYTVVSSVKADCYFQTYAWSGGKTAPNDIYQYQNDVTIAGVAVDRDYVNEDAGLWRKEVNVMSEQNQDQDVNLLVWVRASKAGAVAKQIIDMGYACQPLPIPLNKINK